MGKGFKGKTCVYCAAPGSSTTADHVFARQFFPPNQRANLPIVPACATCNNEKSRLEHYLATVLPFGSRHASGSSLLNEATARRLYRNRKLHQELARDATRVEIIQPGGETYSSLAVPFDSDRFRRLFTYVARALPFYHWDVVVPAGHEVGAVLLNPPFEPTMRALFLRPSRAQARGDLADGLFRYEGVQATDDPALTIWRFQAYGGLVMAGDPELPEATALTVWAVTGRDIGPFRDFG